MVISQIWSLKLQIVELKSNHIFIYSWIDLDRNLHLVSNRQPICLVILSNECIPEFALGNVHCPVALKVDCLTQLSEPSQLSRNKRQFSNNVISFCTHTVKLSKTRSQKSIFKVFTLSVSKMRQNSISMSSWFALLMCQMGYFKSQIDSLLSNAKYWLRKLESKLIRVFLHDRDGFLLTFLNSKKKCKKS